jgi:MFS family permease
LPPDSPSVRLAIRRGRLKFAAMAGTYFLGVLNDNFFKQAAMLLAIEANLKELQGLATVVFTAPFVLFAAPAGWLADRYPKRSVVIASKVLELAAMIAGALGVLYGQWSLILVMLAVMGTQATIFSPALNGAIPELYPASYVTRANSLVKALTTAAILAGVALAGYALGIGGASAKSVTGFAPGRMIVAAVIIILAVLGILVSLGVPRGRAAAPHKPFPWYGPLNTLGVLRDMLKDRLLTITVIADTFFWFVGSLQVLLANVLGKDQFQLSDAATSTLVAGELAGIALGGLLAGRLARGVRWFRVLAPAAAIMAATMLATAVVPWLPGSFRLYVLAAVLGLMGFGGGLFIVPLESFIQVRAPADRKGAIIAAANFTAFSGILISGLVYIGLVRIMPPSNAFALMGLAALAVCLWLLHVLRRT